MPTPSAFSIWLRTGRRPQSRVVTEQLEYKFNAWHDPASGRFTFAGTGQRHGGGATRASTRQRAGSQGGSMPGGMRSNSIANEDRSKINSPSEARTPRQAREPRNSPSTNPITEFAGGVGDGLYAVAERTVESVRDVLTTNPMTTVRNAGRGIAGMIDNAISAEDTPAVIQASRTINAIRNASARDIGRTAGSIAGNVALGVVPEAAFSKLSAVRRLRLARPRPTYPPPQIGWAKERHNSTRP